MNGTPANLDEFGLDSLFLQFLKKILDKDGGIPVFPGAAVECYNFYDHFFTNNLFKLSFQFSIFQIVPRIL